MHISFSSIPDRWPEYLRPHATDDPQALRRFASAYELEMCYMIVSRSLRDVVRGLRYTNWPMFPYNIFLHLPSQPGNCRRRG